MAQLAPSADLLIHVTETLYAADEAILGVASLLSSSQLINVDFADLRAVISGAGLGLVAVGRASGPDRASEAARAAISSPLLDIELRQGLMI
ncbi:hypothetical protein EMIHUDRAFT_224073 [Emiliania huxleyi CCMP1516]|uniref:Cell division protein FtsZ C-terminal domain-containing protein n=2 Tax=Emiliania huxleyi TaxID=2903 RepID=A0A0D3KT35_EMIH1|nr:hypothetical protein EMIHUDRAFT_224073 [Emiliania huxleyi CCMP1516]EOD38920.1 hypothetical protein EMIHUDRAFT_224073 [Emiliania huxleyi CCMP1516]|eukprot:XP_005791349.1 hypothetical protein EMIHUDRAFT_224073 [Emiliania huxleyi CCMP1516]